jgi:hypothetical protein
MISYFKETELESKLIAVEKVAVEEVVVEEVAVEKEFVNKQQQQKSKQTLQEEIFLSSAQLFSGVLVSLFVYFRTTKPCFMF